MTISPASLASHSTLLGPSKAKSSPWLIGLVLLAALLAVELGLILLLAPDVDALSSLYPMS